MERTSSKTIIVKENELLKIVFNLTADCSQRNKPATVEEVYERSTTAIQNRTGKIAIVKQKLGTDINSFLLRCHHVLILAI